MPRWDGGRAASRNQAASALAFLYRDVLGSDALEELPRAKGRERVPTVLSHPEFERVLAELTGKYRLIGALLYGTGMRVAEALSVRLRDLDYDLQQIAVKAGKGAKDRRVPLPRRVREALRDQERRVRSLHRRDRAGGGGWAALPGALHRKVLDAGYEARWQFLFPASRETRDPAIPSPPSSSATAWTSARCSGSSATRTSAPP